MLIENRSTLVSDVDFGHIAEACTLLISIFAKEWHIEQPQLVFAKDCEREELMVCRCRA